MIIARFINIERLIHSLKTCIACILAFILTKVIDFPADQWIIVTVIVVMCAQIYVGGVIQKSYLRFLGTLTGCLFAASTLMLYGHTTIAILSTVGIASFIFSYIATSQESLATAGTLGAVTTSIIMIGQHPTVTVAAERFMEISIGILIAALVSQFILPIHARTHLRRAQANTLTQLRAYYVAMISSLRDAENKIDYHDLDEAIVKTLLKQRQLAKESVREPLAKAFDPVLFAQTLYCEREMLRAITFMHTALARVKQAEVVIMTSPIAKLFNDAILNALDKLRATIIDAKQDQSHITLPSLESLKQDMYEMINSPSREEMIYIDGFLFSAEVMLNNLKQLAIFYNILAKDILLSKADENETKPTPDTTIDTSPK